MQNETSQQTERERILADYAHNNGRITQLGQFEGEPVFAPWLWSLGFEGFADGDSGTVYSFKFPTNDPARQQWPELHKWLGRRSVVRMSVSNQGFVHCF